MFENFLVKYINSNGVIKHTPVDENNDVFKLAGMKLGGTFIFNETNIVTVSGVNSLKDTITEVSGASSIGDDLLNSLILAVSGASSIGDDILNNLILAVSGGSSLRDDAQDLELISVSGDLANQILEVSGASSLRDDDQDNLLVSVSGDLYNDIIAVSGISDSKDASLQNQINAITTATPEELIFNYVSGTQIFSVSGFFSFDPSNLIKDIQVFRNTSRKYLSSTGVSGGDYEKLSATEIEYLHPLVAGDIIAIRKEGGAGLDLENIGVDPAPAFDGAQGLGKDSRAWDRLVLKDRLTSANYEVIVSGGVLTIVPVP